MKKYHDSAALFSGAGIKLLPRYEFPNKWHPDVNWVGFGNCFGQPILIREKVFRGAVHPPNPHGKQPIYTDWIASLGMIVPNAAARRQQPIQLSRVRGGRVGRAARVRSLAAFGVPPWRLRRLLPSAARLRGGPFLPRATHTFWILRTALRAGAPSADGRAALPRSGGVSPIVPRGPRLRAEIAVADFVPSRPRPPRLHLG